MHKFEIYLSFFVILLSTTVLFQNCSESSSNAPTVAEENNNPSGGTPPEDLVNQTIDLDNKGFTGGSTWSVGGDDIFYYETTHRATTQSTMVTITGENGVAILKVEADSCDDEKSLSITEADAISGFFRNNIENTLFNGADPSIELVEGCSFPRMVLDSRSIYQPTGEPSVDFEFYFATRECTPEGELYVADINDYDPEQAKQDAESFFNSQIDEVCGFE